MLWEAPWDPYKVHQLAKIWQKENNKEPYEVAIINEGEGKADVMKNTFLIISQQHLIMQRLHGNKVSFVGSKDLKELLLFPIMTKEVMIHLKD